MLLVVCVYVGNRDHRVDLSLLNSTPLCFSLLSSFKSCLWLRVGAGPVALAWERQAHLNPLKKGGGLSRPISIITGPPANLNRPRTEKNQSETDWTETLILETRGTSMHNVTFVVQSACIFPTFGTKTAMCLPFLKCTFQLFFQLLST